MTHRWFELKLLRWLMRCGRGCLIVAVGAVLVGMTADALYVRADREARETAKREEAERLSRYAIPKPPRTRCDSPRTGAGVDQWDQYLECLERRREAWSEWFETYGLADALQRLRASEAAAESDDQEALARLIHQQQHAND